MGISWEYDGNRIELMWISWGLIHVPSGEQTQCLIDNL